MTHLYIVRHGDSIYDTVDGKFPRRDLGLSAEGLKQAEHLRDRLKHSEEIKPDVLIASPERRAKETAEIIAPIFDMPIIFDEDVEEWRSDDGTLTDEEFMRPWEALSAAEKPYYRWIEGCETLLEFSLRVNVAMNRILNEHQGKTILLASHGAFIQATFAYFFGFSLAIPPRVSPEIHHTSITHWYRSDKQERWILERTNDYHHLK
ncbi:MAG: histidine phosphatase family protein [Aggregatilineales bacterium]